MMKRRFIAGAVCPKCNAMDRIVMYDKDGQQVRECIECGFSQTQSEQQAIDDANRELATRVTPVGKTTLDDGEVALKIVDPNQTLH